MPKKKLPPFLIKILINAGTLLVRLLGKTWKFHRINYKPQDKVIYAFWHRNILPLLYLHKNEDLAVLVSQSQDGDIVAEAAKKLGYFPVRGSSGKGGDLATRQLIKQSKIRSLAITPDGPKGPAKLFKEGTVFLAKITKLPIVLVAVHIYKEKNFNSWDKFRLPLPFTHIKVAYSNKIIIDRLGDTNSSIVLLQDEMQKLEQKVLSDN